MNWYYAKDGQQAGPVDEAELARLVAARMIVGSTLVWKEGMAQWQPYQAIWQAGMPDWRTPADAPPSPTPAGELTAGAALPQGSASPEAGPTPEPAWNYRSASIDDLVLAARRRDDLSATQMISVGWRSVRDNPGLLIGGFLVYMLCVMAAGFIPVIGTCVNFLVSAPLMAGLFLVNIRAQRGEPTSIGEIFSGFSEKWPRLFCSGLITSIIPALPFLPLIAAVFGWIIVHGGFEAIGRGFNPPLTPGVGELVIAGVLYLLALPLAILLSIALGFSLPLVIDRNAGILESLRGSWRVFMAAKWTLIGMWLLLMLLQVAGFLALCVGLLLTAPLLFATVAAAYEELLGSRARAS